MMAVAAEGAADAAGAFVFVLVKQCESLSMLFGQVEWSMMTSRFAKTKATDGVANRLA